MSPPRREILPQKLNAKPTEGKCVAPGTVCIVLRGSNACKRVVVVKDLADGTVIYVGPSKLNGVVAQRIKKAHLKATSTSVAMAGVDTAFLTASACEVPKVKAANAMADKPTTRDLPEKIEAELEKVAAQVSEAAGKVEHLSDYLAEPFDMRKIHVPIHKYKF